MRKMTEGHYYVKCRECGWEGYTLLRGYGSDGHLYLECENCGARNLYVSPPPKEDVIFIGGTVLHDLAYLFAKSAFLVTRSVRIAVKNGWTWFSNQPKLKKFTLSGGFVAALTFLVCLVMFKTYFFHFLAATIGTIAGTLALVFKGGE